MAPGQGAASATASAGAARAGVGSAGAATATTSGQGASAAGQQAPKDANEAASNLAKRLAAEAYEKAVGESHKYSRSDGSRQGWAGLGPNPWGSALKRSGATIFMIEPYVVMPFFTVLLVVMIVADLVRGKAVTKNIALIGSFSGIYVILGLALKAWL